MARIPRPAPPPTRIVRAGGALIWRIREGVERTVPKKPEDIEVLLVHRPRYDDWSWPKGKAEPGEHITACAVREVEEETGVVIRLGTPLTVQRYRLGGGHLKEVYYWVGSTDVAGSAQRFRPPVEEASSKEIDQAKWVKVAKAARILTRRGDRRLLEELVNRLEKGLLDTSTVIVARHAKAFSRTEWKGSESSRPLSRNGVYQARQLGLILSAYGVSEVKTSPWRRCLGTVGPYASLSGAEVEVCGFLSEDAFAENTKPTRKLIETVLNTPARPRVICVHRPTLPAIMGEIALLTPNSKTRDLPQEDPYLKTAELLVLHVAHREKGAKVVSFEVHRPYFG